MILPKCLLSLCAGSLLLTSCSGDDDGAGRSTLTLNVINMQSLEKNLEYEAWIVVNDQNKSLGRFTDVNFPKTFSANAKDVETATGFKISIEPGNDPSATISNTVLLSGNFAGNGAVLDVVESLGSFITASGSYVLQTPTDKNNNNEQAGIYWLRTDGIAGLSLPSLPEGWKYEGWVTVPGANGNINLSTGTFRTPAGKDDSSAYSSNESSAPLFPGEDFINVNILSKDGINAVPDLRNKKVFITIEPFPDNDASKPFFLEPLSSTAGNQLAPASNNMNLTTALFPIGQVAR